MWTVRHYSLCSIRSMAVSMALVAACTLVMVTGVRADDPAFDAQGRLLQPRNYREWVFVGTPLTPNDMNSGNAAFPEFHNVYIHPASWQHYKQTGTFRDGTILVKELVSVGSKTASSGNGYFMGEYLGLEAAVKDSRRFPKESGYWGYFRFTTEEHRLPLHDTASVLPIAACAVCHKATAAEDMVFTQYYPVLRAVKPQR